MGSSELLLSGTIFGGTHLPFTSHALLRARSRSDLQSALAAG